MFSINSCYHFYLVLCSSAALKQLRNIYLFSVHTGGSWINFYSSITADLHKLAKVEHTVFSNIFPEAGILKVFFRGTFRLGVQHYVHSRSLTLRLARVKYWGQSTQLFAYDELTKLTGEFSDLSLYTQMGYRYEMCCPKLQDALKLCHNGEKVLWLDWFNSSYGSTNG